MAERALADTSALLALAVPREQHHNRAKEIASRFRAGGGGFVGPVLVLAELHNLMLARQGSDTAHRVLAALLDDPVYQWIDVDLGLVDESLRRWLEAFSDQSFSLTDAVSFEIMRRERISHAFAFDRHFVTAGFELLR